MARKNGMPRKIADMTGILTVAERDDLITLIARITDKMSREISESFNPGPDAGAGPRERPGKWVNLFISKTVSPVQPSSGQCLDKINDNTSAGIPGVSVIDKNGGSLADHSQAKPVNQEPASQLSELKKELLLAFQKWQNIVLQRVRDLQISETTQIGRGAVTDGLNGRGRGSRSGRGGVRGGRVQSGTVVQTTGKHIDR